MKSAESMETGDRYGTGPRRKLANLPDDAKAVFEELHGGSPATYAIRYAAGFPGIMMVLSGMSSLEQMKENVSFMKDFRPLDEREMKRSRRCARSSAERT